MPNAGVPWGAFQLGEGGEGGAGDDAAGGQGQEPQPHSSMTNVKQNMMRRHQSEDKVKNTELPRS